MHWKTENLLETQTERNTFSQLQIEPVQTDAIEKDSEVETAETLSIERVSDVDAEEDDADLIELYEQVYENIEIVVESNKISRTDGNNYAEDDEDEDPPVKSTEYPNKQQRAAKKRNPRTKSQRGEPPFECETCGHLCASRAILASHRHRKHRITANSFACGKCKKTFQTRKKLEQHEKRPTCSTYPEFVCEFCSKKCIGLSNYNIHLRFHKKQYPFVCHICAKGFMMATHLNTHIKSKHEHQRFFCEAPGCGKSFQTLHSLKTHAYSHLDTMPYKCSYCQRMYPTKGRLRWHINKSHGIQHTLAELDSMRIAEQITLKAHWKTLRTEVPAEN